MVPNHDEMFRNRKTCYQASDDGAVYRVETKDDPDGSRNSASGDSEIESLIGSESHEWSHVDEDLIGFEIQSENISDDHIIEVESGHEWKGTYTMNESDQKSGSVGDDEAAEIIGNLLNPCDQELTETDQKSHPPNLEKLQDSEVELAEVHVNALDNSEVQSAEAHSDEPDGSLVKSVLEEKSTTDEKKSEAEEESSKDAESRAKETCRSIGLSEVADKLKGEELDEKISEKASDRQLRNSEDKFMKTAEVEIFCAETSPKTPVDTPPPISSADQDTVIDEQMQVMTDIGYNSSERGDIVCQDIDFNDISSPENFKWKPNPSSTVILDTSIASAVTADMTESSPVELKNSTLWNPPSIPMAVEFQQKSLFREGTSSLWSSDLSSAEDLSEGVVLYFEFAKSACRCLFILSILSIPSIVISFSGSRIPIADRDALGFSQFTLGNIGYDPKSSTYTKDSRCKLEASSYIGTCINVLGGEMKLADAETVMSTLEFLQIVVFFCFIFHLHRQGRKIRKHERQEDCKVGDYAVMCRRLPKDTTVAQLTKHFNDLYPLNTLDWKGRQPIARTRVVQKCDNSGELIFLGTWVADCVIFSAIGKALSAFKLHEDWTVDLLRSRVLVTMYADETCHSDGPNKLKKIIAEKKMRKVEKKIERLAEHLKSQKEKLINVQSVVDEEAHEEEAFKKLKLSSNADTVAGFVTFEYHESMMRCVEDYAYYSTFPRNLFPYPSKLKFRGLRIKVEQAPDPEEVIWEHLEVSGTSKKCRRFGTALVSVLLLIVSFTAILQASLYRGIFNSKIPSGALCVNALPTLFGAYTNNTDYKGFLLTRPNSNQSAELLDAQCETVLQGSFYAVYSTQKNIHHPVASYDFQACNTSVTAPNNYYKLPASALTPSGGTCPNYGQKIFCPCITRKASATCRSAGCEDSPTSRSCLSFSDSTLGACYCQQILDSLLKSGVVTTLNYIQTLSASSASDSCSAFFADYSTAQGISYGTIFVSIIVNMIVTFGMKRLSNFEAHVSVDRVNAALMIKLFLFTYINMTFTVLIAFGGIDNLPLILQKLYIFQGQYHDFSSEWYTSTGVYFQTAFFLKAVVDIAMKLGMYAVVAPIKRWWTYSAVEKRTSHYIVTQYELNQMLVGPAFDPSVCNAGFLSKLFFAMTYATGLPLMMPMAFATLSVLIHVDRLLLLRFNQKPPQMGDEVMRLVLEVLPFAAIIRLTFGCWMYSFPDIFDTVTSSSPLVSAPAVYYKTWLIHSKEDSLRWFSDHATGSIGLAVERVFRPNVFPLLLLLLFVTGVILIHIFWKFLPFFWIEKAIGVFSKLVSMLRWSNKIYAESETNSVVSLTPSNIRVLRVKMKPLRHSAPFTGEYYSHLPRFFFDNEGLKNCCDGGVRRLKLSRRRRLQTYNKHDTGWLYLDSDEVEGKSNLWEERGSAYKVKKWTRDSLEGEAVRRVGDFKRTYEVIRDNGCSSYALEKIPGYAMVIEGFKEGNYIVDGLHREAMGE